MASEAASSTNGIVEYDAIIIGAGISGMYQLLTLRRLGLSAHVFEAGTGVGGVWYWNRYPGARFDSESWSYGYGFDKDLLTEWEWSEHFAAQPETLRYLSHVADRFDLRRDISFSSRVKAAHYDEVANLWRIELEDGRRAAARLLVSAVGPLSAPVMPRYEGMDSFAGEAWHTGLWPHSAVDFSGKRVAVIGTGATGVQLIQEVAKSAAQLTVFQRSPNWCAPLNNSPIDAAEQARLKRELPDIIARCNASFAGFIHEADRRSVFDVSAAEREAIFEGLYAAPGFGIWLGNFRDTLLDQKANDELSRFVANKIRGRVKDPALAEKLIPTSHGFGTRRVPMETGYYEVYNQPNVELVDISATPIERITPRGIVTREREFEFDIICYATGFDAVLGSLNRIDVRGLGGLALKDCWAAGPRTYLGLTAQGFPNFFTLVGPHNAASFCNIPRCIEQNVEWVRDVVAYMQAEGLTRIEPREEAVEAWTQHVLDGVEKLLFSKVNSWFMGVNPNIPGRQQRHFLLYAGGLPLYRKRCEEEAASGYANFRLS
ncbi:MAG: NAD(P)/FAD-dependent oxidoreductase [Proteobacteria bacterium]|nr:NAD(P)/FAD-dependent oxidoreductase [Pseudomonadota bacterium]